MFLNFDIFFAGPEVANNRSNSTDSTPKARVSGELTDQGGELTDQGNNSHPLRGWAFVLLALEYNSCNILSNFFLSTINALLFDAVLPDFAQVYTFIGSVFDPNASDHVQKLKKMDPIDVETVCYIKNSTFFFHSLRIKVKLYWLYN